MVQYSLNMMKLAFGVQYELSYLVTYFSLCGLCVQLGAEHRCDRSLILLLISTLLTMLYHITLRLHQ